jgi:hypothetical protein
MDAVAPPDIYLIYVWLRDIHPLLWWRVLVRADSPLADLHWVLGEHKNPSEGTRSGALTPLASSPP